MKKNTKTFFINSFNNKNDHSLSKTEFIPSEHFNVNLKNNIIEPLGSFEEYISHYFSTEEFTLLQENYSDLLNNIIHIQPYKYYSYLTKEFKTRLFIIDSSLNFCEYIADSKSFIDYEIQLKHLPDIFEMDEYLYFSSKDDTLIIIENENAPMQCSPNSNIKDFVDCNNVLYFITYDENYKLFYTEKTQLFNISNDLSIYDSIDLDAKYGKVLKAVVFNEKIYVFQQYKITKIEEKNLDCTTHHTCEINCNIFDKSIQVFDDYIVFLNSRGIILFDGNDIQIAYEIYILENNLISSVTYDNNYYFFDGKYLREFDLFKNIISNFKVENLINFYTIKNVTEYKFLTVVNNDNKYLIYYLNNTNKNNSLKYIKFNKLIFETNELKTINSIKFTSKNKFNLKIKSDTSECSFFANFDNFYIKNVGISGHFFEFEFLSEDYFLIDSIFFTVSTLEDFYE